MKAAGIIFRMAVVLLAAVTAAVPTLAEEAVSEPFEPVTFEGTGSFVYTPTKQKEKKDKERERKDKEHRENEELPEPLPAPEEPGAIAPVTPVEGYEGPAAAPAGGKEHQWLTGYLEHDISSLTDAQDVVLPVASYDKLRIGVGLPIGRRFAVKLEMEARAASGELRDHEVIFVGAMGSPQLGAVINSTADVPRVYLAAEPSNGDRAFLGRQPIVWKQNPLVGALDIWNTVDFHNPTRETDGFDGIRYKTGKDSSLDLDIFGAIDSTFLGDPATTPDNVKIAGARVGWRAGDDYGFSVATGYNEGLNLTSYGGVGYTKVGDGGTGLSFEYSRVQDSTTGAVRPEYNRLLSEVSQTLPNDWTVDAGYFYNGSGVNDPSLYTLNLFDEVLLGHTALVGKSYAVTTITKEFTWGRRLSFFTLTNTDDNGSLVAGEFSFKPYDGAEMKVGGIFPAGPSGTEFKPDAAFNPFDLLGRSEAYIRFRVEF